MVSDDDSLAILPLWRRLRAGRFRFMPAISAHDDFAFRNVPRAAREGGRRGDIAHTTLIASSIAGADYSLAKFQARPLRLLDGACRH